MKKYVIIALLFIGCTIPNYTSNEFSIFGISDVEYYQYKGEYIVTYIVQFTPNVIRYSLHYYYLDNEQWIYAKSFSSDVDREQAALAHRSIGLQESFIVSHKIPLKVEIVAYAGDAEFLSTVRGDYYIWKN